MPYTFSPSQAEGLGETALAIVPQVPTNLNYKLGSHEVFTNPYKGTRHTVENMIRLVKESQGDMVLRRFVENLCRGLRPKDYVSEAAAIYYWSCKNLRYMRDPRLVEMLKSPRYILENYKVGGVDCLPGSTVLLRNDYTFIELKDLQPGMIIWGLNKWTEVKNVWCKGVLKCDSIKLNNGSWFHATPDHHIFILNCKKHPDVNENGDLIPNKQREQRGHCICPLGSLQEVRVKVSQIHKGMALITPSRIPFGSHFLDSRKAYIEGLYLSDGWVQDYSFCISGKDGFPKEAQKREVQKLCKELDIPTTWYDRFINVRDSKWTERMARMSHKAPLKHALSINIDEPTAANLLRGIMADSGKNTCGEGRTFTTTSRLLERQARILWKMFGRACSERFIIEHGGLGDNPIWRLGLRQSVRCDGRRDKVLRIKGVERETITTDVYDLTTEDGYVYLPDADVTVSNCDDLAVWISSCCSIAGMPVRFVTVGFKPRSLTIRPAYTHVFASAQDVKSNKWMVLDPVAGPRTEPMLKSVKQAAIYDVG